MDTPTPKPLATPASAQLPSRLELVEDDCRLVSVTFGLSLYTNASFYSKPKPVLQCLDQFLELCPRDQLRFYKTESMSRHKPVTERALGMLATWLRPGAPQKEDLNLQLKDGTSYQDAPLFAFEIAAAEDGSVSFGEDANLVKMTFPVNWAFDRTAELLAFTNRLCSFFPFQSGHAGLSFECSPYEEEQSQTHAWKMSMRHRGIDISRVPEDCTAVGHDAVKGVNWLTILNDARVKQIGGLPRIKRDLPREIEILQAGNGVILKAGSLPAAGDTNRRDLLPLYKSVYRLVAPLVQVAAERALAFDLAGEDYVEMTERWFKRFADA